ncbi:M16 family metallopeptidase [Bdellovibrio sp. HCB337]|uniref:M16 family metallopeptidase n=1 Tax=Bdellovibrio sp. HCB337 TaxID=3394358 RepID=UPI0039A4E55B
MSSFQMKNALNLIILSSLVGCAGSNKKAEAPKSEKPAAPVVVSNGGQFKLRPMREVQLENGLRIVFITDNSLPRVSMTMLAKVGSRQDPAGKEGLNNLTSQLLEQGTQTKNAMALADELGQLGTEINIESGNDFTVISMDALVNTSEKMLGLYSDIVMNPAFLDVEVARAKSQIIAQQQKKVDNPSNYANDAFDEFLFLGHPYANDVSGTPVSVRKITKQDIIRHYLNNYRPNNSQLAVVGRVTKDFESKVAEAFKKWTGKPIRDFSTPELKPIQGIDMKLLSKAGLQQAQIRIGEFGIRRNDPDFLKLRLANVALGGEFGSRLNQYIRDDLGLTYSIYSYFDSRADRGPFVINTFTKNETVGKTVDESLKLFSEFVEKGLNEKEFNAAKEQLLGQFPRAIETADRLAYNILILNFYGVPLSYLQDFNKNVAALSLNDVNIAIQKHLDAKNLRVLVYADEKKVADQLSTYKPKIEKAK